MIPGHKKVILAHFSSMDAHRIPAAIGEKAANPAFWSPEGAFSCLSNQAELGWDQEKVIPGHRKAILKPFLSTRGRIPMARGAGKVTKSPSHGAEQPIFPLAARKEVGWDGEKVIWTHEKAIPAHRKVVRGRQNVIGDGKKVIAGHFPVIGDGRLTFASLPMAMIPVAGPSANAMNV